MLLDGLNTPESDVCSTDIWEVDTLWKVMLSWRIYYRDRKTLNQFIYRRNPRFQTEEAL